MAEKMYIPTFIADANFKPTVVQPRAFFYNGKKEISTAYKFTYQSGPSSFFVARETEFPYFDHYSSSSIGQDPNLDSESLLFFNEGTVYGFTPQENLYTQYWSKYVGLLYNPATRFLECSGVIPFGRYVNMKLNDVVIYKGNHFHLRAINNYNLNTGECNLQLLGPILDDTFDQIASTKPTPINPNRPTTTTSTTTTSTTTSTSTTSTSTTTTTTLPPIYGPFQSSAQQGEGQASSTNACALTVSWPFYTDAADVASITNGNKIYINDTGTLWTGEAEWYGVGTGIGVDSVKAIRIDNTGVVIGVESCTTTTTTTEAPIYGPFQSSAQVGEGQASAVNACAITVSWPFYTDATDVASITTGNFIYTNSSANPWAGEAEWYGVGTGIGADSVKAIRIDNTGEVIGVESCTTTTTTTENSYNFSGGTSITFSNTTPGEDPKTVSISGTATIVGLTKTFKVTVSMPFNYGNLGTGILEVDGFYIDVETEGTSGTFTSVDGAILSAGSYPYTLTAVLDIVPPATSGAITVNIINV